MTSEILETGRTFGSSEPVMIRVRQRGDRLTIDDNGAAVRLAGQPPGWHDQAERIVRTVGLNVNRRGVVFVPLVGDERRDRLIELVATTSLEVYDALLGED